MAKTGRNTILLVMVDAGTASAEARRIKGFGYDVVPVNSGEKAFELASEEADVKLVLTEIGLGAGIDGIEAAKRILVKRNIPILFYLSPSDDARIGEVEELTRYGCVLKGSGGFALRSSIRTAFELFEAREKEKTLRKGAELKEHEAAFERNLTLINETAEIARIGGWRVEAGTGRLEWTRELYFIHEVEESFVPTVEGALKFYTPESADIMSKALERLLRAGEPFDLEAEIITAKGNRRRLRNIGRVNYDGGKMVSRSGILQDITERKQVEAALRASEEKFRSITEQTSDLIALTDAEGRVTYASAAAVTVFGYDPEEMRGRRFVEFLDEKLTLQGLEAFRETMERNVRVVGLELKMRRKDGSVLIGEVNGSRFCCGDENGTLVVIRDITERKFAEERIKSLLAEKELLLREVNHRIKNNMNTINSLLSLQAGTMKDPAAVAALEDAGSRVRSMMILYDKLYRSADFIEISVQNYLGPLIDEIVENFPHAASVKIEKKIDDFILDARVLQPLGIVINELVTNSMKYAFGGGSEGKITITASLRGRRATFVIQDNGCGIPEETDFENCSGFGLTLVGMLIKQMKGEIRIVRDGGTKTVLELSV